MVSEITKSSNTRRIIVVDGEFIDSQNHAAALIIEPCEPAGFGATGMADEPSLTRSIAERMEAERASDEMGPQTIQDAIVLAKQLLPGYAFFLNRIEQFWVNDFPGQQKNPTQDFVLTITHRNHGSLPPSIRQKSEFRGASWKEVIEAAEAATLACRGVA